MKTSSRIRIVTMSLFALIALGFVSKTFAAVNAYIIFTDKDGKDTKVTINKDGSFSSSNLSAGTYSVSWVFNHGPRQTTSADDLGGRGALANGSSGRAISAPAGGSADRESSAPSISEIAISYDVKSPRDAQSGLATGRRMHQPFVISMSSSERLLPTVNKKAGTIAIDEPGVQVTGTIEVKDQYGNKMGTDDWTR